MNVEGDPWVAQRLSLGVILGPRIEFHVGLPAWSLLLPLPGSLSLMNKQIKSLKK